MAGQVIGYKRVSSGTQNTERQELLGCDEVFEEFVSGKDRQRPQLEAMMKHARKGDTVVVHSIDRLARSLQDLQEIVDQLVAKGVTVKFLKENLTFSEGEDNATGRLMLQVLGSIAEFERTLIRNRQREGIERAKHQGKYEGRKRSVDYNRIIGSWEADPTKSLKMIAKHFDCSVATVHRALSTYEPYRAREDATRNLTPLERARLSVGSTKQPTIKLSDLLKPEQMKAMTIEQLDVAIQKAEERAQNTWNEEDQMLWEGEASSLRLLRQDRAAGF